jgi:hypothetical protein
LSTISSQSSNLFIIPEEDLDRQPSITADFEAFWHTVQLLHLLLGQFPPFKLKVRFNTFFVDRLGNNRPPLLKTPCEQYLLRSLSFFFGNSKESLIRVQRGVRAAEAGVAGAVNAFRGVVRNEFRGRVVWMEFDLVDSRDNLKEINKSSECLEVENTLHDGSLSNFSRCVMPKLETPMFRTLPVAGSFCISCHVLMKSQSG